MNATAQQPLITPFRPPRLSPTDWRIVADSALFRELPQETAANLVAPAREAAIGRGTVLFRQDELAHGCYLVLSGKIKHIILAPCGRECVLRVSGPGDPLGLTAMFNDGRYRVTAEAITPARLLLFPRGSFLDCLAREPVFTRAVLGVMAAVTDRTDRRVYCQRMLPGTARVARFLLDTGHPEPVGTTLRCELKPLQLTAAQIGIARETMHRILDALARRGAISYRQGVVRILDEHTLDTIAGEG
ncbi:MAG: Crp/Fnr family transcriptional regulator [Deltaproteobacteria bacterium]|nr:Crp/Fnr family transcriptional regulator [Candidatus Anaeroferrophillacea bacterium]